MHTAPSLASNKHTTLPNIAGWDILGMWGCAWRCQAGQWLILACTPFGGPNQRWQRWTVCTTVNGGTVAPGHHVHVKLIRECLYRSLEGSGREPEGAGTAAGLQACRPAGQGAL